MTLFAKDCSPFDPQPTADEAEWLRRLATGVSASDFVVSIAGDRDDDEPIVYCDWDGTWWAGRYVGTIFFERRILTIRPRFGLSILRNWLFGAASVVLVDSPGRLSEDQSFIAQLLAYVWVSGFVDAARHGLPALRQEIVSRGPTIRGRLDVAASLRLIATNSREVVSVRSERSLDHATSRAIVAAYSVLRRWLPDENWLTPRAKELIPNLLSVTGPRPRVPTKAELGRIRYTPITAGFAPIAELSRQIANRRGLTTDIEAEGRTQGVMLDVAELWEMYVLNVLRKAATPLVVKHGTREPETSKKLLYSEISRQGLGTLIPDAIIYEHGDIRGVVDAKYKSIHPSATAPYGPKREDLYQIVAYLDRFTSRSSQITWGLLAYPDDPDRETVAPAELNSPWSLNSGKKVVFAEFPHQAPAAIAKMQGLISDLNSGGVTSSAHAASLYLA